MVALADYVNDERSARIMLSALAEADDPTLGSLLGQVGALRTLDLLDSGTPMPGGIRDEEADVLRFRIGGAADERDLGALMRGLTDGRWATVIPGDARWPKSLDDLGNRAPYVLWARGATSLLNTPSSERITFSGSRAATGYGTHVTRELATSAVDNEQVIVSGGAYGIDAAAHRAALTEGGHAIAVMSGGLDRPYPAGHAELLSRVADIGLVVSEQPPGIQPSRQRFIARNRLLAGLSGSTLIVEAGPRSGSMQIAREAAALGRAVGAVPGPVTSAASYGTHILMREGTAQIVTNGADLAALTKQMQRNQERSLNLRRGLAGDEPGIDAEAQGRSL